MQPDQVAQLRKAVQSAQQFAHSHALDACDASDIDELVASLEREFGYPHPNPRTVGTYLNSLLRSLRSEPAAGEILPQLEDSMRAAHIEPEFL